MSPHISSEIELRLRVPVRLTFHLNLISLFDLWCVQYIEEDFLRWVWWEENGIMLRNIAKERCTQTETFMHERVTHRAVWGWTIPSSPFWFPRSASCTPRCSGTQTWRPSWWVGGTKCLWPWIGLRTPSPHSGPCSEFLREQDCKAVVSKCLSSVFQNLYSDVWCEH